MLASYEVIPAPISLNEATKTLIDRPKNLLQSLVNPTFEKCLIKPWVGIRSLQCSD